MISARQVPRGTQRTRTATIAAPVGGWNARDPIGNMPPKDANILRNFWPGTGNVVLRKGYTQHVTGISGQVETLMTYTSGTTEAMFGAAGTSIYNVTSSGAVGAASKTGMTNARFQYVNFTNSGGSYLLAVNGADKMIGWNGSAWYQDGDGAHDITGFDTSTAPNIAIFKNRIFFLQNNTLKAWYLGALAISGAATPLDMSSLCQFGGYLMAAMTWTLDAGYGVDDYLAFITSQGEVIVWRLTDPSTVTGIALIGVYQIGAPVGRRCWIKYGGDLLIITQDGVVPMSGALQSSRTNPRVSLTDKIQFAMSQAVSGYGSHFGWQLIDFPKASQLYLNVPIGEGLRQEQYVQNNITRSWGQFTGWEANCFELLGENLYFGGNGFVGHAWNGLNDAGEDIQAFCIQAFQSFGSYSQKQSKMIRFHLACNGSPAIFGNVSVDYSLADVSAELSASVSTSAQWNVSKWNQSQWGSGMTPNALWQGATGVGYTFAPTFKCATNGLSLEWTAMDIIFEAGGAI